jgi:nickel-dependent lactate racemase
LYRLEKNAGLVYYRDQAEDVELTLHEEYCAGLIEVEEPLAIEWPKQLEFSLRHPVGSPPLAQLAEGRERVAIIVPDVTRGVPVADILPTVIHELERSAIRLEQVTVVIATGVHRPASREEIATIVGSLAGRVRVINHNPFEPGQLVYLGTTRLGTPIEINRTVFEADLRIAIGKVEPHEFAGFSGGRKAVLPGVASEHTIQMNHSPEMLLVPRAAPGLLEGNPVSEDMDEAADMLGLDFIVNTVQGTQGQRLGVFAGELKKAHREAVKFVRSFCGIEIEEQPDIIVTTPGPPLNIDLYQSLKSIIALGELLQPGGIIVLYSACPDGFGTTDMFTPYKGVKSLEEVITNLKAGYKIQMDHALLVTKVLLRGITVIATSPNIPSDVWSSIWFRGANSPQEALAIALATSHKSRPRVLFYPQPQRTLPRVKQIESLSETTD